MFEQKDDPPKYRIQGQLLAIHLPSEHEVDLEAENSLLNIAAADRIPKYRLNKRIAFPKEKRDGQTYFT